MFFNNSCLLLLFVETTMALSRGTLIAALVCGFVAMEILASGNGNGNGVGNVNTNAGNQNGNNNTGTASAQVFT